MNLFIFFKNTSTLCVCVGGWVCVCVCESKTSTPHRIKIVPFLINILK
ncbi:MAG: hypothetical protein ACRC4N_11290 [Gammaproteobacteria bacterium]